MSNNTLTASQRTYTDVETGYRCRLYTSNDHSNHHLIFEGQPDKIADGTEIKGFYIAAHTGATIKLNNKKKVMVNSGEFYHLKPGENVTHRQFVGFNKFFKI